MTLCQATPFRGGLTRTGWRGILGGAGNGASHDKENAVSDTLTTTRWYVCFYPNKWGRGTTVEEAKKAARKAGGRGTEWYIKLLPEDVTEVYVDGMGGICWSWPKDWSEAQYEEARKRRAVIVDASRVMKPRLKARGLL